MKHVFLVNRIACDGQAGPYWQSVREHFLQAFPDAQELYPDNVEEGIQQLRTLLESGQEICVVTVGGEGTMNRALNGILATSPGHKVVMALVPFGNVNDYAANIGLKKTWQHALETLQANRQVPVGVVRVTTEDKVEYALNIADIGFGATTAKSHSVDRQLSWLKGQLKYNVLALKTLFRWKNVQARIFLDDTEINDEIAILLAGFSPTLGGFHLLPHGNPVRQNMAVAFAVKPSKLEILGLIEKAKRKQLAPNKIIRFHDASRIRIETERPVVVEVDGEIVSTASRKMQFEAMPGAIPFVVPPDSPLLG